MQYASKMYEVSQTAGAAEGGESDEDGGDIESEIQKEIEGIRKPAVDPLFTSVKLDTQCCKLSTSRLSRRAMS